MVLPPDPRVGEPDRRQALSHPERQPVVPDRAPPVPRRPGASPRRDRARGAGDLPALRHPVQQGSAAQAVRHRGAQDRQAGAALSADSSGTRTSPGRRCGPSRWRYRSGGTVPRTGRTPTPVGPAGCRRWSSGSTGTCSATTCRGPAAPSATGPSPSPPAWWAGARRRSTARCSTRCRRRPSPAGRAAPRPAAGPDRRRGWRPRCADPSPSPSRSGPRWATASSSSVAVEDLQHAEVDAGGLHVAGLQNDADAVARAARPACTGPTRQLPSIFRCEWMLAWPTRMNRCLPRLTTSSTRCAGQVDGGVSRHANIAARQRLYRPAPRAAWRRCGRRCHPRACLPGHPQRDFPQPFGVGRVERIATPPRRYPARPGVATTGASLQSSKYRPPMPSSIGDAASSTDVAAPCSTVLTACCRFIADAAALASTWRPSRVEDGAGHQCVGGDPVVGPALAWPRRRTARWRSWTVRTRRTGRSRGTHSRCRRTRPASADGPPNSPKRSGPRPRQPARRADPTASAKWPRWFEANCISCPLADMVSSGTAITPALFTRMSSGPVQARTKAATLDRSLRSIAPTPTLRVAGAVPDLGGDAIAVRRCPARPA